MKTKKIISAAAAVMMAAMPFTSQLPSTFNVTGSNYALTAEAAKNAVRISVIDSETEFAIEGIEVSVARSLESLADGEPEFRWNTSENFSSELLGAYDNEWYISLKNVPDDYVYDEIYTLDRNTRTSNDFKIRLRPKKCNPNFSLRFCIDGETTYSQLYTINFNIYDKKGSWICTVRDQDGVFLQDGDYVIKADKDALKRAGYSISGASEKEFTINGGVLDLKYYTDENYDLTFVTKMNYTEDQINTRFYIKDGEDGEPSEEGIGLVHIKGEGFSVVSGGALYLGDGHYVAHRNAITKDPFKVSRFYNRDSEKLEAFADQILNDVEDIEFNIVDGKPDRELVFVKKPVQIPTQESEKSDAKITVRDAATGKNIEGIDVEVIAGVNASGKTIAKWNTSEEAEKVLKDLTVNPDFCYAVRLGNVPAEYSSKEEYIFNVEKANITENWTVELEKAPEVQPQEGATATITVRDKDTGAIIKGIEIEAESGLNASAQSIGSWNTADDGVKTITGLSGNPDVCYGFVLKNVPEEYDYKDAYVFCFDEGSKTAEWNIELVKKPGAVTEKGTSARVAVRDMATGKNIEGIDIEVISGINATGKSIAKWNTSDEAEKTLTGLTGNMQLAYGIKMKNVPEKYVHEDTYVFMRTEGTEVEDWTISLVTSDIKENITFDMYDWSEEKMFDFSSYDKPMYAKITDKNGYFCYGFSGGYSRALPDGEYTFELVTPPEGYVVVMPESDTAKELKEKYLLSEIEGGIVNFTMKDGKPDKEIVFDIIKKPEDEGIGFRLYSRYKGLWEQNGGVGSVTIKDSKGKEVGKYDLNEKMSLPDGRYTSELEVYCKGYSCFSEGTIEFNVKDGKADKTLDYNIEIWNFDENGSGDANGDDRVDISDAVLIMQSIANPSKYGVSGTDKAHITEEGNRRADVDGEGVTNRDALTIQKYLLGLFRFE